MNAESAKLANSRSVSLCIVYVDRLRTVSLSYCTFYVFSYFLIFGENGIHWITFNVQWNGAEGDDAKRKQLGHRSCVLTATKIDHEAGHCQKYTALRTGHRMASNIPFTRNQRTCSQSICIWLHCALSLYGHHHVISYLQSSGQYSRDLKGDAMKLYAVNLWTTMMQ